MSVLIQVLRQRTKFDASNKQHVATYKEFIVKRKWENLGCPYELEWPYLGIPDMIKDKIINHYLKI
jgi:hypothetical protein